LFKRRRFHNEMNDFLRDFLDDVQDSKGAPGDSPFARASSPPEAVKDSEKFTKVLNDILEKVMTFGFTRCELLVVLAVIRKTWGWHKDLDGLSYSQVSNLTRIDRRHVRRTMTRLRDAGVFLCGVNRPDGYCHEWGINKCTESWSHEVLQGSRGCKAKGKAESLAKDALGVGVRATPKVRAKSAPRVGAKSTPGGEGRIYPPQKKELKKEKERGKIYGAAFAAPPLSSSSSSSKPEGEKQGGSIGSPKDPPSVERPSPAIETRIAACDQIRIVQLCGELEAGGVNSYSWVAEKRRKGALAAPLIRVLEKAMIQRPGAADFDAFAEKVFEGICSNG
jgi:phage replication O-like protein O